MTSDLWFSNLVSWWLQTGVIAALAAILLRIIPVRSPRLMLAYLQGLLGACLLLPVLEPWRAITVTSGISAGTTTGFHVTAQAAYSFSLPKLTLVVIAAGIAVRLFWLAIGYWRLRRYRTGARPAGSDIACLTETLGVSADVCVSPEIPGAATFGFWRPAVLLPLRWRDLDPASRRAVVNHELLHVQRKDWAFHVAEELIRALIWFHPAIWWLTAEIRLAREQVVDGMVVALTSAPKAYAEVLLAFAGNQSGIAPAFTERRRLARRIKSLLEETAMTKSRLLFSFASITFCLAIAGAVAVWSFPLESVESILVTQGGPTGGVVGGVIGNVPGGVQGGVVAGGVGTIRGVPGGVQGGVIGGVVGGVPGARTVASEQNPKLFHVGDAGVTAPKVRSKVDPEYTPEARDAKIEGTVVVETEIHPDGRAHNTTVVRSLDQGLDHNAIEAISHWQFQPASKDGVPVAVKATIEVNFRLN